MYCIHNCMIIDYVCPKVSIKLVQRITRVVLQSKIMTAVCLPRVCWLWKKDVHLSPPKASQNGKNRFPAGSFAPLHLHPTRALPWIYRLALVALLSFDPSPTLSLPPSNTMSGSGPAFYYETQKFNTLHFLITVVTSWIKSMLNKSDVNMCDSIWNGRRIKPATC